MVKTDGRNSVDTDNPGSDDFVVRKGQNYNTAGYVLSINRLILVFKEDPGMKLYPA